MVIRVIVCVPGKYTSPLFICTVDDGWFRLDDNKSRLINVGKKLVDGAIAYSMGKSQNPYGAQRSALNFYIRQVENCLEKNSRCQTG